MLGAYAESIQMGMAPSPVTATAKMMADVDPDRPAGWVSLTTGSRCRSVLGDESAKLGQSLHARRAMHQLAVTKHQQGR